VKKTIDHIILFLAVTVCIAPACKKHREEAPPVVTITGIDVNHGPLNTMVTISGSHFGHVPAAVVVAFNDKPAAAIISVTDDKIKATVPERAGTGTVKVTINGQAVEGPVFTYEWTATVSNFAGTGAAGSTNGALGVATFNSPTGIATDAAGNILIADLANNKIRKITIATGQVSTLAGSTYGYVDGAGATARFGNVVGICVDGNGNTYVGDLTNNCIRKITPGGTVSTLAGTTTAGTANGNGATARFSWPSMLVMGKDNHIYVADRANVRIRKVSLSGDVTTFAGGPVAGTADGTGGNAQFNGPAGIATDAAGNLYVSDINSNNIRKITTAAAVTTLAGLNPAGFVNGTGLAAKFNWPYGMAVDASNNVYIADASNHCIRKITPGGIVSTFAGSGAAGYTNGVGTAAAFDSPSGVAFDAAGNLLVADQGNNRIRVIAIN
jgi:serine/threonine-protein kinase